MYSDKTEHGVTMSIVVTRYLNYIEELYQLIENNIDKIQVDGKTA
jgi:NTE family protein